MKHLLVLFFSLSAIAYSTAQETPKDNNAKSSFGTGMDVYTDFWMDLPEAFEARTINQGMNFYVTYRNPINSGPFSTSIGISFGAHNLFSNGFLDYDTSGSSIFVPIKGVQGEELDYKRNKLVLAYVDLPLEIMMQTKKGFFASLGVKAGFLLNAHTKYKGEDPFGSDRTVKVKQGEIDNIESYRLGGMARVGYKWFNVYGYYSFSKVFKEGLGPEIYPISIGITLRPN